MLAASTAYSLSLIEMLKYRKVQLPLQTTCLLVNRITGRAEYIGEENDWTAIATLPKHSQEIYQSIADNN